MLQLRQGKRRYRLATIGENHATLARAGKVKPGPALLYAHRDPWYIDVTSVDGLTVQFNRRRPGRPPKRWDAATAAQVKALLDGGMTQIEVAKRFGMCRDTLWRKLKDEQVPCTARD